MDGRGSKKTGAPGERDGPAAAFNDLYRVVAGRGPRGASARPFEDTAYGAVMAKEQTALAALDAVAARAAERAARRRQFLHLSLMQVFASFVATFNEVLYRLARVKRPGDLWAIAREERYHTFFGAALTIGALVAHIV